MIRIIIFIRNFHCHVLHHRLSFHHNKIMTNNVVSINENNLIDRCIRILKNDGILAVPTDTIYGFAALVNSEKAVRRIYEIKGRLFTKPLAISVGYVEDLFIWSKQL